MMCRIGITIGTWLTAASIGVALLCAGSSDIHARQSSQAGMSPVLELAHEWAADRSLRALLDSDRRWMASQPRLFSGSLGVSDLPQEPSQESGPWPRGEASRADSVLLDWLRQLEQAAAGSVTAPSDGAPASDEPLRGHRDLLSLLRDRWLSRGYLAATIDVGHGPGSDPAAPVPILQIDPGPLFTVREMVLSGDDFSGRRSVLDAWMLRPGEVFHPGAYLESAAAAVLECAERGYPFPIWMTRSIRVDLDAREVTVAATLMPGPRMVVGPQSTNLPQGRGEGFLIKAARLDSGRLFRESDLRRGRGRLEARGLYTRVDEPLVHMTTAVDTVGIVWIVEPLERANRLSVVLGLSRRDEGGSRLSGQVDLDLPNLAGTGRRLSAQWRDDGRSRSRFGFRYMEPLVLGTPLDADLALQNEVLQDAYTLFKIEHSLRLPVAGFWGLEIGMGWDRTTYPEGELSSGRRLRWRAGVSRQRGDVAVSGWSGTFAVETARRSMHTRPAGSGEDVAIMDRGGRLGRQDRQRLLEVDLDGELWVRKEMSLAGRASLRQIDTEARPIPLPELYRFGGAGSLRGYREDAFLGEVAAWGGAEARFGRARRSRVYTFLDVGYLERTTRLPDDAGGGLTTASGLHAGYGLGLLTMAAPGQINLAVAFPGSVDFETAMLHVSLLGGF
jgi:outer membrane protein assembly factor BamA